ncbi:MAG TPA: type II toxin-antitoxin system HipA family toxin [Solirubrobacterales bacterium]|nr:type II toxin-antitoxin system HipA family toxin [Solirubrobacterales bacterium]
MAEVRMWGRRIGAVALADGARAAEFEYTPEFARSGIEVAPVEMPLVEGRRYSFPELSTESFRGLPGMLSDSLPDRFGNALIDAWLARQGREPGSMGAVERLCYTGRRGMGALEYLPATGPEPVESHPVEVEALAELAAEILAERSGIRESFASEDRERALGEILRVGTSAGGARAKALLAFNPETMEVRSGQLEVPAGFEHWILKFDGVQDQSREIGEPRGYGVIEFAYAQMARAAGIEMTDCHLLEDAGRRHFMTRRFDRTESGRRLHMQSLAALGHLDFNLPGANSYEQAFRMIDRLGLGRAAVEQQFLRMVFNVVARNQDDHVKNIAFLMDRGGEWALSPAFDLTWAYNPTGRWTSAHQMSINGKRDGFEPGDFFEVGKLVSMKRGRVEAMLDKVTESVSAWPELAADAGVEESVIKRIADTHRLDLGQSK